MRFESTALGLRSEWGEHVVPRKFDFASLESFVAVCECRSITHAAEVQNISASAISKRITHLEEFAGTPLLVRTNSGVAPTNEGVRLLEHARNVLYNVDLIERDVRGSGDGRRGFVRIVANRSANAEFVAASVASFLSDPRHRHIDIHIGEMTSHEVVFRVKDGLAAIGVCWAETDMTGVEWKPSKRDVLSAIVPINHPLAKRHRIAFAETLDYEQVGILAGGPVTNLLRRESIRSGKLLRYRVVAPTFDAMVRVVASGLIAIMPSQVALRFVPNSGIALVPLTDAWKERQFAVCCRSRRALTKPASELFDHLVAASVKSP
jgi:DNA-binding transcriptional LysR family regulator